jgi:hypothetical protein
MHVRTFHGVAPLMCFFFCARLHRGDLQSCVSTRACIRVYRGLSVRISRFEFLLGIDNRILSTSEFLEFNDNQSPFLAGGAPLANIIPGVVDPFF